LDGRLLASDGPLNRPEYENITEALFDETTKRLKVLLEHYKIKGKGRMTPLLLAVALANDFVPNFDVFIPPRKSGRPRSRNDVFGPSFKLAVEAEAERRGKGIADACLQLSKKRPWVNHFKASTLETRYHEEARKFDETQNALHGLLVPKPGE
jgi:hypothetical protein